MNEATRNISSFTIYIPYGNIHPISFSIMLLKSYNIHYAGTKQDLGVIWQIRIIISKWLIFLNT